MTPMWLPLLLSVETFCVAMATQQALYHPNGIYMSYKYTQAINRTFTSSGLGGTLLTTGEGTGLLGDGTLSALERSLAEPRLLLLATAHMCRNLCCSSCSQYACLLANASSLRSYAITITNQVTIETCCLPLHGHQSHLTEIHPQQGTPSNQVLVFPCILTFQGEQMKQ